ncbi:MAG: 16S rRNA (adenine(1518)-N(6)/adenine(1519)-N(6))-dimethyltransferase RsmA [Runella sp.]
MKVKAKKHLGQHFLRDMEVSARIAESLTGHGHYRHILEIGPGTGVLTQFLLKNNTFQTYVVEIDRESVAYLKKYFGALEGRIIEGDFLRMDLGEWIGAMGGQNMAVIGNFPYHISSQILFKALDHRDIVTEIVGMFQKEVAMRVASPPGKKDYGILSVLLQAYYDVEYLFTVPAEAFEPPPKVLSGVIRLKRNEVKALDCNEQRFKQIVKIGFNQRRKTLRNALKPLGIGFEHPLLDKRAEQLSVADFVLLTRLWEQGD